MSRVKSCEAAPRDPRAGTSRSRAAACGRGRRSPSPGTVRVPSQFVYQLGSDRSNSSGWQNLMRSYGVSDATAARLIRSLAASGCGGLAFCRLLERWARGEPGPTAGAAPGGARRAAERAETALADWSSRSAATSSSWSRGAEGRSWYGEPGPGEVVTWDAVLRGPACGRAASGGTCLPRARRARARPPGPLRLGEDRVGSNRRLALGRPLRPAREPPRRRPRRPARACRLKCLRQYEPASAPRARGAQSPPRPHQGFPSLGFPDDANSGLVSQRDLG